MSGVLQDVRFALRAMARRPAACLLAVLTCALGIGSSVAMFSVVDTVLLRPLPYPEAARIVSVYPTIPEVRGHPSLHAIWDRASFSQPEYLEWRERQTSFVQAAALSRSASTLFGEGGAQRVAIGLCTPELFAMLGAVPVLGRTFTAGDARVGAPLVVVISHAFWQTRFGGARDVIGQSLRMEGGERTIIGVLPASFHLKDYAVPMWAPIPETPDEGERENHSMMVLARLAPGVTVARAQEESTAILQALSEKHRTSNINHGANVVPRLRDDTREVRLPLMILLAAAGLLLVIACVNVAALVLGMGIDREPELVVRSAMGAGRPRLLRQLVTEGVLLSLMGGAGGVLLAMSLTPALVQLAPAGVPRLQDVQVDVRVMAVAFLISAITGIAFGLVPGLLLTRDLAGRLRDARSRRMRARLHRGLVVVQIALATVLLGGAALLTRSLLALRAVNPGFDPRGVLTVQVAAPYDRFRDGDSFDGPRYDEYFGRLERALAAIPGVEAVAITTLPPFSGSRANNLIEVEGYTPAPGEVMLAERYSVSANYMEVMRMRIVEGRGFTAMDDRPGAQKVTVVSESFARQYWPNGSAVGRWLRVVNDTYTIIGVVADVRDRSLAGDDYLRYYLPRLARGGQGGHFVLRTTLEDPASLSSAVRTAVLSVDPELAITAIAPMTLRICDSLSAERFRTRLIVTFAALAAVFAVLGIYGVTNRAVASRTREIGIRVALGAQRASVIQLVLRQGLGLAVAGIALGVLASLAALRTIETFLYGTTPADPVTLTLVATALALLAVLASLLPSRRAASIDPQVALRAE